MEILNVAVIRKAAEDRGLKLNWIAKQVGLKRSAGYMMLKYGVLPDDHQERAKLLNGLSQVLDLPVTAITVRVQAMAG